MTRTAKKPLLSRSFRKENKMKVEGKLYSVSLTEDEIDIIANALHACYKEIKETPQENQDESRKAYERMQPIRKLRNSFAQLIYRSYMGEDA